MERGSVLTHGALDRSPTGVEAQASLDILQEQVKPTGIFACGSTRPRRMSEVARKVNQSWLEGGAQ